MKRIKSEEPEKINEDYVVKSYSENGGLLKVELRDEENNAINIQEFDGDGRIVKSSKYSNGKTAEKTIFDKNGYKIRDEVYSEGVVKFYNTYGYDDGKVSEARLYDDENILLKIETYVYDQSGDLKDLTIVSEVNGDREEIERNESVFKKTLYDKSGFKIMVYENDLTGLNEAYSYYKRGVIDYKYELSPVSDKIKKTYYRDGMITNDVEYDLDGNKIKETGYQKGEVKNYTKFEYNETGKQIKRLNYNKDDSLERVYKYEYDEKGIIIRIKTYDSKGALIEYE
jgi:antitoxin component YwqK of YwqJK toxin-antitoxin module